MVNTAFESGGPISDPSYLPAARRTALNSKVHVCFQSQKMAIKGVADGQCSLSESCAYHRPSVPTSLQTVIYHKGPSVVGDMVVDA